MNYGKFANTYKNGKIISKKDKWGRTRAYTIEELEQLVDELANDKDEDGKVKDPQALNNANMILFQMYQRYGNPHEEELLKMIKEAQKEKTLYEQKQNTLEEVNKELAENKEQNEEYVEFEEVKDGEQDDKRGTSEPEK